MSNALRGDDPGQWGHSLANLQELMYSILETAGVRSIAEIGAYAGDLTGDLADFAESRGGEVIAVDPQPQPALAELADARACIELVREPSESALRHIRRTDAVVIDGDHNYHTVSSELATLAERFGGERMPLLLVHDVRWPHARRDNYFDPDAVPAEKRQPFASGCVFPDVTEIAPVGLPFRNVAAREGGPRNGVLTALEDFLGDRKDLRAAIVPAFFGLGVVWPSSAGWADELARLLAPWDRTPWLERLEHKRAYSLARLYAEPQLLQLEIDRQLESNRRKAEWMERLADSRAFRLAERLASLRGGGASWSQQLRGLVDER